VEKHNQALPSDADIRAALKSHTSGNSVSADDMWQRISTEIDKKPESWRPWFTWGAAAALLGLIILLNWPSVVQPPEPHLGNEPQIMRFSAFEPLSVVAEVDEAELRLELTAHTPLEFGSNPAVVEIMEGDSMAVTGRSTVSELAGKSLNQGEKQQIHVGIALPQVSGQYQVRLEVEVITDGNSQVVSTLYPIFIE